MTQDRDIGFRPRSYEPGDYAYKSGGEWFAKVTGLNHQPKELVKVRHGKRMGTVVLKTLCVQDHEHTFEVWAIGRVRDQQPELPTDLPALTPPKPVSRRWV